MQPRNVSGAWTMQQSNGWRVDVSLVQNGATLSGTATTMSGHSMDNDTAQELDGTVSDTQFSLNITWSSARGRYEGTFQADDSLSGVTFDIQHPDSQATWFSAFDKKFPIAAPSA